MQSYLMFNSNISHIHGPPVDGYMIADSRGNPYGDYCQRNGLPHLLLQDLGINLQPLCITFSSFWLHKQQAIPPASLEEMQGHRLQYSLYDFLKTIIQSI